MKYWEVSNFTVTIYTLTSEGIIALLLYPYISYDTTFMFFIKYAPIPSLYSSQVAYPGGAYPSFHSMKQLEVLQLLSGLEWQSITRQPPPPPCISSGFPDNSCNMLDYEQFLVFSKVCPTSKKKISANIHWC